MSNIFAGLVICQSGKLGDYTRSEVDDMIKSSGGKVSSSITKATTHLICSEDSKLDKVSKFTKAEENGLPIVKIDWLDECVKQDKLLDTKDYSLVNSKPSAASASVPSTPSPKKGGKKRKAADEDEDKEEEDDEEPSVPSKPAAKKAKASKSKGADKDADDQEKEEEEQHIKKIIKKGAAPIDEHSPLCATHHVYEAPDGTVYDCALQQTNIGKNANKAYFIQIQVPDDKPVGATGAMLFTRWGRTGEAGQHKLKGPFPIETAIREFRSQFSSKAGISWDVRATAPPKAGKYAWLERSIDDEEEEEGDEDGVDGDEAMTDAAGSVLDPTSPVKSARGFSKSPSKSPSKRLRLYDLPSNLHPEVLDLAKLIFNQELFDDTLAEMQYDAKRLPLGKLTTKTLDRGLEKLNAIAQALSIKATGSVLDALSSDYYTAIPHRFPRSVRPTTIDSDDLLKKEMDLISTLREMEISWSIMNKDKDKEAEQKENPYDRNIADLKLKKIEPLDKDSDEFKKLKELGELVGETHRWMKIKVVDIFRIEREGEEETWSKAQADYIGQPHDNRRLVWHGSRLSNFGGILNQGIRIAPPHAPVNGYMFAKGAYFANLISKSAQYLYTSRDRPFGLLVLSEVQFGKALSMYNANYKADEDVRKGGYHSTLGVGTVTPAKWTDAGSYLNNSELKNVKMPFPNAGFVDRKTSSLSGASNAAAAASQGKTKGKGEAAAVIPSSPADIGYQEEVPNLQPSNIFLQYDEAITYDVDMIRFRYLFKVEVTQ